MQNENKVKEEVIDDKTNHRENSKNNILEPIKMISSLTSVQLEQIAINFSSYDFTISGYKKLVDLLEGSSLDFVEVSKLIVFLRYLQDKLGNVSGDKNNFESNLTDFLKLHGFDEQEAREVSASIYTKLWEVYNDKSEITSWYKTGIIDSLLNFDGFVEIRPVFIDDKMCELLPVAVLRVALTKDYQNPQNFVFQVSYDELEELERKITKMKERLGSVGEKLKGQEVLNIFINNTLSNH